MPQNTNAREAGKDVLRAFADALVPYLRDRLQICQTSADPAFYSQTNSPLGRRRHLDLVRRGTLRAKKVGRLVLVRREDVHSFIERHPSRATRADEQLDDPLTDWGLASRRRK